MGKSHQVVWDEKATAAENARRELPAMVTGYFARVREFLAKDPSPPELHRLRLFTKRLRYTLELFSPCYGPGLEERMAELRELQKLLGEMNDSATAGRLLSKAMKASARQARVEKFLEEQAEAKAKKFRAHWDEVFDAGGRERWWTAYLRREGRSPGRRAEG